VRTVLTALWYNLFCIAPAELFLALFGRFFRKLREGIAVRRDWERTLRRSLALLPRGERILFHASSAGELQQALPVIRSIKEQHPSCQIGISFYSTSGMNFFKGDPAVAFTTYMPFDSPKNSMLFMTLISPKAYVIASWDMWFNHCLAARNIGSQVILIAGVLAPDSSRLKFPLRGITAETLRLFTKLFTVSDDDAQRMNTLTGGTISTESVGDPRYDHILDGIALAPHKLASTLLPQWESKLVITLGSIWEPDWEIIGQPLLKLAAEKKISIFAAPHQMHESFLSAIESACVKSGVRTARYTQLDQVEDRETIQVIIIDTIGILAALYLKSSFAYVGGAMGKGVHNVAEPAAFGLPLWFGPKHHHSLEARRAVETGAAVVVNDSCAFEQDMLELLNTPHLRLDRSDKARAVIHNFAGATTPIAQYIGSFLDLPAEK